MTEKEKDYAVFSQGDPNMADKLKDYQAFVSAVLMHGVPPEQASAIFAVSGQPGGKQAERRPLTDEELRIKKDIVDSLLM